MRLLNVLRVLLQANPTRSIGSCMVPAMKLRVSRRQNPQHVGGLLDYAVRGLRFLAMVVRMAMS